MLIFILANLSTFKCKKMSPTTVGCAHLKIIDRVEENYQKIFVNQNR